MPDTSYRQQKMWCKVFIEGVVTEDGVYVSGNLPGDYGGSTLYVNIPVLIMFAQFGGVINEMEFTDYLDIKDSGDQKGIGVSYTIQEAQFDIAAKGPSTFIADATVEFYTDQFTENEQGKLDYFLQQSLLDRGLIDEP